MNQQKNITLNDFRKLFIFTAYPAKKNTSVSLYYVLYVLYFLKGKANQTLAVCGNPVKITVSMPLSSGHEPFDRTF
jgi:hypothetical protein